MKAYSPFLGFALWAAIAPLPVVRSAANDGGAATIKFQLPAGSRDYLWTMIACDEKEERYVDALHEAFLGAVQKREIRKGQFEIPAHFAERSGPNYLFERAYYVAQNTLKGFSLAIPAACITAKDGMLSPACDLVVTQWTAKQGLQLLNFKAKP